MKIRLLIALIVLGLSVQLQAQINISGRVFNEDGVSLPSAHVSLSNSSLGVVSDREGFYYLNNIRPGDYDLQVSFIGYETWTKNVYFSKDTSMNISLRRSPVLAGEVIVKANRANVKIPVAHTNISKEELAGSDRARDIPFLLELVPSVVATSDAGTGIGYSGLRIRGTDPSRINVTVNGIPYNDSESHDVYWVDIPDFVSSVENVQVQRGVGTSTQGAAAFGANINFQTRTVSKNPYAELQSTVGSFSTFKNAISAGTGLIHDHLSIDMRLSRLKSDGYIDRAFADMSSHYISAGWYGKKNIIKATAFSGKQLTYQAWGGVPGELLDTDRTYNPYTYDNEVDDYKQDHYQLHWSYQPFRNMIVNLAMHYTRGKGYYEQYKEDEDLEDYLLKPLIVGSDTITNSDLIRRKWLDNDFYGGVFNVDYTLGDLTVTGGGGWNRYDGDHFGRVIWGQYASNGNIRHPYYYSNGLKTDWNYFTRVNFQVLPSLNLYADLQYRHINYIIDGRDDDQRDITQDHIYNFFNPKAGVSLNITRNQEVYFSFSVGNREPKRSNFTDASPGQEIKPERLNDFEIGYRYLSGRISAEANAYFMDYTDQLVLTGEINDVGSAIMVNVPDSYRVGLELMLAYQPVKSLKWEANATISRNRVMSFVELVDDWDTWGQRSFELENTSLAFSPEVIAGSRITWTPLESLDLSLLTKYVGKQFIDNTSSADRMLDDYLVNSFRLAYTYKPSFLKEINVFVDLINLLNEKYETNAWVYSYFYEGQRGKIDGYYPQAGRHFMAGITISL